MGSAPTSRTHRGGRRPGTAAWVTATSHRHHALGRAGMRRARSHAHPCRGRAGVSDAPRPLAGLCTLTASPVQWRPAPQVRAARSMGGSCGPRIPGRGGRAEGGAVSPNSARAGPADPPSPSPSPLTYGRADPRPSRQGHLKSSVQAGAAQHLAPVGGSAAPGEWRRLRTRLAGPAARGSWADARRPGCRGGRECGLRSRGRRRRVRVRAAAAGQCGSARERPAAASRAGMRRRGRGTACSGESRARRSGAGRNLKR